MADHELERFKTNEPYRYWFASKLAPSRVVRSYPFMVVWLLLLNSTVVCTYRRVKGHFKLRKTLKSKKISIDKLRVGKSIYSEQLNIKSESDFSLLVKKIESIFKKRKWKINHSQKNSTYYLEASKGGIGFWGSIVFHLGLILLFIGAGISSLTRFEGAMLITENYTLPLQDIIIKVAQKPLIFPDVPGAIVSMKKIKAKYGDAGQLTDFSADMSVASFDGISERKQVGVNQPLQFSDYSILPEKYGISPLFFLKKKNKIVDKFNINLGSWLPEGWTEKGAFDSFLLDGTNYRVKVQFIPNLFIDKKGKVFSKGGVIKKPALILTVLNEKNGKEIEKKLVKKNESIKFAGQELIFKDLNFWGYFKLIRDYGLPVVMFSMIAGLIGLVIRYIYHDKSIWLILQKSSVKENCLNVKIGGRSRYFPALFNEELKKIGEDVSFIAGTYSE